MNVLELAKAIATAQEKEGVSRGHSILVYGAPKSGKSALAATAAESKNIDNVYFFDNENSWEVMLWMLESGKLSEEAAAKIKVINISDNVREPHAIETMLKVLNSMKAPVYVRYSDGKIVPQKPREPDPDILEFQMSKLTLRDVVITDSLSQLGDSAAAGIMLGRGDTAKMEWDDYAAQGKWLGDCLSIVQQAKFCNFICVTHEILLPDQDGIDKFFPMCGTKPFCHKVAKYFGTVITTKMKVGKHIAGSKTSFSKQCLTGSRRGIELENMKKASLASLFDTKPIEKAPEPAAPSGGGTSVLKRGSLLQKRG
jgi:hypothetical protein